MRTYEELLLIGEDEKAKGDFCYSAIREFMQSREHKEAETAEKYYCKRNETIEKYQKWLYTVSGRKIEDVYSANYKLKTLFFRRMVIQLTQYLLANGVNLQNQKNKEKLGKEFDSKVQQALKYAMVQGKAFGFWNADHLEVFGYACTDKHAGFCPMYSEKTAEMMAGIRFRFKQVGKNTICKMTLFEPEGMTEFSKNGSEEIEIIESRKAYKTVIVKTEADGVVDAYEENYGGILPIFPLYANDCYDSEFVGLQEQIDCFDLIKSGFANNIDDASEIYWLVKNCGGMDDEDLAHFLYRLKTQKVANVDASQGGDLTSSSVQVPTEARKTMLEMLRADLYEDMMILDMKSLSGAQKTAQELQTAYQAQDNKADDIEYELVKWLTKIFEIAGIPDEVPTFVRSKVVNEPEQTAMVLSASNYLSPECIIKHLPFLSSDEQEEEIKNIQSELYDKFNAKTETKEDETEEEDSEEEDEE